MRHWLLCAVTAILTASAALANETDPSPKQIEEFASLQVWRGVVDKRPALLVHWVNDARAALGDGDLKQTTVLLAAKYGLPREDMAELLRLWILSQTGDRFRTAHERRALDQAWAALASASNYNSLVLQAIAKTLGSYDSYQGCDATAFGKMLDHAPDKLATGWQIARYHRCDEWLGWLLDHAGERRFVPLTEVLYDINLRPHDLLPIYAWLTSKPALAHVAAEDREAVQVKLSHDYAEALWAAGQIDQGLAVFEQLPAAAREKLLAADRPEQTAHADGLAFDLGSTEADKFRLNLAAALVQKGRADEAQRIFARSTALTRAQKYIACHPADPRMSWGDPCGDPDETFAMAMLLDAMIGKGSDKLGVMAQSFFADAWLAPKGLLWTELSCRAFVPRFTKVCTDMRQNLGYDNRPLDEPYGLAATAAVRSLPHADTARASLYAATMRVQKIWQMEPTSLPFALHCEDGVPEFPIGEKLPLGPARPGRSISYRDPQSGISFYVESDGRHLAAINPDGVLKWVRDPFVEAHLCPYRTARPVIVAIEPVQTVDEQFPDQRLRKNSRIIGLRFDSSQFGAVDVETGDFIPEGQN